MYVTVYKVRLKIKCEASSELEEGKILGLERLTYDAF